jgi:putative membrane protein
VKGLAALGLAGGLALAVLVVLSNGVQTIWHSALSLGWLGFAIIVGFHLCLYATAGGAWWLLGRDRPDGRPARFVWARVIRDSAAEALPLSQIGGYVVGARALTLAGVSGTFAAASTVVDVTVELVAQLGYTLMGLLLLIYLRPQTQFALPGLAGISLMAVLAGCFIAIQARGASFAEKAGRRLVRQFLGDRVGEGGAVQAEVRKLHARPRTLAMAVCVHLAAWIASGVETWLTLLLMHIPLSLGDALVIDSLLYGMRSVAFVVPNALGVQEGGLVLLAGLFGIGPDAALALSLIKRARDIFIAIPALLAWQAFEGRRAWSRFGGEATLS